jgi:putative DNA-invertase from lambdoid prophage Rac
MAMILGYARVSPGDAADAGRSSYQIQTDIIEGFARTRGVDKYGVQIFTDAGVSGAVKLASRPAGADLLAAMSQGDIVIASKLDRMFRSASDAIAMFEEFKARGVHLVLYDISNEPVSSGVGKLIMTILAAVADMERIRIKERTAAGRSAKKAKGGPVGEAPFGYRRVGVRNESTLIPDRREQEAAALMRSMYQAGATMAGISQHLHEQGYVSRRGKPYHRKVIRDRVMEEVQ